MLLEPLTDHWHGCTVLGGLGRSVLDVATFDDVIRCPVGATTVGPQARELSFAAAARCGPGRLRIAVSLKPAIPGVKPAPEALKAVAETVELLRSLASAASESHTHDKEHS
jgi:amidase